jgi:hypothetical protein
VNEYVYLCIISIHLHHLEGEGWNLHKKLDIGILKRVKSLMCSNDET